MNNYKLPVINSSGAYELLSPLINLVVPGEVYTCKAIRNLSDYIANNEKPLEDIYLNYKLTEADYKQDLAEDMPIAALQAENGYWIYAPARFISKYPLTNGHIYKSSMIGLSLPSLPIDKDLQFLQKDLINLVETSIGVTPISKIVDTSRAVLVSDDVHKTTTAKRLSVMSGRSNDKALYKQLELKYNEALYKIKELEEYILNHEPWAKIYISVPTLKDTTVYFLPNPILAQPNYGKVHVSGDIPTPFSDTELDGYMLSDGSWGIFKDAVPLAIEKTLDFIATGPGIIATITNTRSGVSFTLPTQTVVFNEGWYTDTTKPGYKTIIDALLAKGYDKINPKLISDYLGVNLSGTTDTTIMTKWKFLLLNVQLIPLRPTDPQEYKAEGSPLQTTDGIDTDLNLGRFMMYQTEWELTDTTGFKIWLPNLLKQHKDTPSVTNDRDIYEMILPDIEDEGDYDLRVKCIVKSLKGVWSNKVRMHLIPPRIIPPLIRLPNRVNSPLTFRSSDILLNKGKGQLDKAHWDIYEITGTNKTLFASGDTDQLEFTVNKPFKFSSVTEVNKNFVMFDNDFASVLNPDTYPPIDSIIGSIYHNTEMGYDLLLKPYDGIIDDVIEGVKKSKTLGIIVINEAFKVTFTSTATGGGTVTLTGRNYIYSWKNRAGLNQETKDNLAKAEATYAAAGYKLNDLSKFLSNLNIPITDPDTEETVFNREIPKLKIKVEYIAEPVYVGTTYTAEVTYYSGKLKPVKSKVYPFAITMPGIIKPHIAISSEPDWNAPEIWKWKPGNDTCEKGYNAVQGGIKGFVAVGDKGLVKHSDDAISWIPVKGINKELDYVKVAYGNGTYMTVAKTGEAFISQDGIDWKEINSILDKAPVLPPPEPVSLTSFITFDDDIMYYQDLLDGTDSTKSFDTFKYANVIRGPISGICKEIFPKACAGSLDCIVVGAGSKVTITNPLNGKTYDIPEKTVIATDHFVDAAGCTYKPVIDKDIADGYTRVSSKTASAVLGVGDLGEWRDMLISTTVGGVVSKPDFGYITALNYGEMKLGPKPILSKNSFVCLSGSSFYYKDYLDTVSSTTDVITPAGYSAGTQEFAGVVVKGFVDYALVKDKFPSPSKWSIDMIVVSPGSTLVLRNPTGDASVEIKEKTVIIGDDLYVATTSTEYGDKYKDHLDATLADGYTRMKSSDLCTSLKIQLTGSQTRDAMSSWIDDCYAKVLMTDAPVGDNNAGAGIFIAADSKFNLYTISSNIVTPPVKSTLETEKWALNKTLDKGVKLVKTIAFGSIKNVPYFVTVSGNEFWVTSDLVTWTKTSNGGHSPFEYVIYGNDTFITTCEGGHSVPLNDTSANWGIQTANSQVKTRDGLVSTKGFPSKWSNNKYVKDMAVMIPSMDVGGLKNNSKNATEAWYEDNFEAEDGQKHDWRDISFGTTAKGTKAFVAVAHDLAKISYSLSNDTEKNLNTVIIGDTLETEYGDYKVKSVAWSVKGVDGKEVTNRTTPEERIDDLVIPKDVRTKGGKIVATYKIDGLPDIDSYPIIFKAPLPPLPIEPTIVKPVIKLANGKITIVVPKMMRGEVTTDYDKDTSIKDQYPGIKIVWELLDPAGVNILDDAKPDGTIPAGEPNEGNPVKYKATAMNADGTYSSSILDIPFTTGAMILDKRGYKASATITIFGKDANGTVIEMSSVKSDPLVGLVREMIPSIDSNVNSTDGSNITFTSNLTTPTGITPYVITDVLWTFEYVDPNVNAPITESTGINTQLVFDKSKFKPGQPYTMKVTYTEGGNKRTSKTVTGTTPT